MTDSTPVLPEEFSKQMQKQLGPSYAWFVEGLKEPSPVSVRLNPHKKFTLDGDPVAWCRHGRYLSQRPIFTLDPALHAGAYYVQEASSMFLEQTLVQLNLTDRPLRVLDLCAAPGGKSTHLLSLLHPESLLVANEVIRARAMVLAENVIKWGNANLVITNNDPAAFQQLKGFFDVVVVDAPCSGEGLFRKDRSAVEEWSTAHTVHCSKRQDRILSAIWPSLKTNGILIYSTCTYNTLENEQTIERLATKHRAVPVSLHTDQSWGIEEVKQDYVTGYRFYPHRVRGEGFFMAVLRKEEYQPETSLKLKKTTRHPDAHTLAAIKEWVHEPESFAFNHHNDTISILPQALADLGSFLPQHFSVLNAGTPVAKIKGGRVIPEHALALSIHLNKDALHITELGHDESVRFLRKENIVLPDYHKGHSLVTFHSLPLGWLNILEGRANNLYPKEWRIRMTA